MNINNNKINIALLIVFSTFLGSGFLVTASMPKKTNLPPSSAGIGSKFNRPILMLKNPVKTMIDNSP